MKYEDVKTPLELFEFLENNIEYGFCDSANVKHYGSDDNFSLECQNKWKLSFPELLLKNKLGICWDLVELERDWFSTNNYIFKTIFICFLNTNLPTHTYLIYKDNNKWYWFEHSDYLNKGIHEFNRVDELMEYQCNKHLEYVLNFADIDNELFNKLRIYEYDKPNYNINSYEIFSYVVDNGKDITDMIM